ncbi:hypothetical protein Q5P01_007191 [Channa striata]|uniref:Uncharacterized protein n=1 Tax=Channa striata TaxID=64152 RepID=A0AA88SUM6_CHASR|nr:hypothetical protein Q5P01_007191 [Channa striata]
MPDIGIGTSLPGTPILSGTEKNRFRSVLLSACCVDIPVSSVRSIPTWKKNCSCFPPLPSPSSSSPSSSAAAPAVDSHTWTWSKDRLMPPPPLPKQGQCFYYHHQCLTGLRRRERQRETVKHGAR